MKKVTSVTVFNDAVGLRMSMTYSEIDEETGKIITDNKRLDRIVTDKATAGAAQKLFTAAQEYIDTKGDE